MAQTPKPSKGPRPVEALQHHADTRPNIPTAEFQSMAQQMEAGTPAAPVRYKRAAPLPPGETRPRNADLDPQLVWQGMKIRLRQASNGSFPYIVQPAFNTNGWTGCCCTCSNTRFTIVGRPMQC